MGGSELARAVVARKYPAKELRIAFDAIVKETGCEVSKWTDDSLRLEGGIYVLQYGRKGKGKDIVTSLAYRDRVVQMKFYTAFVSDLKLDYKITPHYLHSHLARMATCSNSIDRKLLEKCYHKTEIDVNIDVYEDDITRFLRSHIGR